MSTQKVISFQYELKENGSDTVLDSNLDSYPLEFVTGSGMLIPGLEKELLNMGINDKADILVMPEDAYGEYNEAAIDEVPKEQFAGIELEKGMLLYGQGENGETIQVVVKDFNDESVLIDYNHPMAGKELLFSVNIVDIRDATEEEIATGQVAQTDCEIGCGCH